MKKTISILVILVLGAAWVSCKKDTNLSGNIILYDQPLNVIQKYGNGNWKLIYSDGGYTGMRENYDSTYWQLSATRIKQTYPASKGGVFIDTTINWIWGSIGGVYSGFVIQCFDDRSYEYDYVPIELYNDTLILFDDGADGLHYHFIKNN